MSGSRSVPRASAWKKPKAQSKRSSKERLASIPLRGWPTAACYRGNINIAKPTPSRIPTFACSGCTMRDHTRNENAATGQRRSNKDTTKEGRNQMDSDRAQDLATFANAAGQSVQPVAHGHALVRPTTGLAERIIGAQRLDVYRDEAKILQKLTSLAAAAGSDWFYRFPVRKKDGGSDWIEGPSIKLANDVARIYGNNVNEVRELD